MTSLKLRPGSLAPRTGIYEQVGPHGRTGSQISVLSGRPLPVTPEPGNEWELISAREDRHPPPMQVVTKGWWTLKEERAPVEELEKEDRNERRQA
jgi:hypothetical protein